MSVAGWKGQGLPTKKKKRPPLNDQAWQARGDTIPINIIQELEAQEHAHPRRLRGGRYPLSTAHIHPHAGIGTCLGAGRSVVGWCEPVGALVEHASQSLHGAQDDKSRPSSVSGRPGAFVRRFSGSLSRCHTVSGARLWPLRHRVDSKRVAPAEGAVASRYPTRRFRRFRRANGRLQSHTR